MKEFVSQIKNAFKNIVSRKGRSLLTVLGIVIGVTGVVVIVSLGTGAQSLILGQITKLGSNLISILPGKADESGPPAAVFGVQITTLTLRDLEAIEKKSNVPNLSVAAPVVQGSDTVKYRDREIDTSFIGSTGTIAIVQNLPLEIGTFFSEEASQVGVPEIVLGHDVYTELFQNENPLGKVVKLGQIQFRVVGVLEPRGALFFQNQDDAVYIPFIIAQRQILGINYVQYIRAKIDNSENVKIAINDISRTIRDTHNITRSSEDDFEVRDLADAIKILEGITNGLKMFLGLMASISLVVGGIGISNIMLVTVTERTREIGLRKALGATAKKIRNQFLLEAVILTTCGGLIGIVFGIILSYFISLGARFAGYDWQFAIPVGALLLATSVSVFVGVVFGLYPAVKAARLDPIEALRHE